MRHREGLRVTHIHTHTAVPPFNMVIDQASAQGRERGRVIKTGTRLLAP